MTESKQRYELEYQLSLQVFLVLFWLFLISFILEPQHFLMQDGTCNEGHTLLLTERFRMQWTIPDAYYSLTMQLHQLLADIHSLMGSSCHADVLLLCKNGKRIPAHKALLACRCPRLSEVCACLPSIFVRWLELWFDMQQISCKKFVVVDVTMHIFPRLDSHD